MADKRIHIGTSGWSYKDWKGIFYPEKMKASDWLSFYAEHFDTTEINSSFYRMPTAETVLNWATKVPEGFTFCPKMSRFLTHMKKLNEPEEPLRRFFEVFAPIKPHLGPILLQLPPFLKYNPEKVVYFFELLKSQYAGYDFALEVRHNTWMSNEAIELMKQYDIAWVISQSGVGFPYAEHITSEHIYFRFHGPRKLYASSYPDETLKEYALKFKKWHKAGHTLWIYFNNDWYGYGINNANTLKKMLKIK